MIRAIRPSAVARDEASLIGGWNIAPNVGYTISLSVSASAVVVILASLDGATLIGSGLALVGVDQPVTITPVSGQTISMVDADLGWHLLVTASGTEGERTITIDPMVDLADEIHPIYTDDDMALARATAAINSGASYVDDVSVNCPLGIGAGLGAVASVPVDGVAVVGQVESVTWSGTPDGTSETAVIRRHTAIAPEAYEPPLPPPILVDDTAETDAVTAASGNVLANDTGTLTVVAVNGLSANVGEEVAGSNGGEFVINADGAWMFDPSGDFAALSGSDTATTSVSYHASNGKAESGATLTVTVTGSAAGVETDPYWENTVLCINPSGASGSTIITDATSGHALTAYNGAQIDTTLGYATIKVDGINDYVSEATTSADWAFGTSDFCVEGFIQLSALPSGDLRPLVCLRNASASLYDNVIAIQSGRVQYSNGTEWHGSSVSGYIGINTMWHFAVTYYSGVLRIFYDGMLKYQVSTSLNITVNRPLYLFRWDSVAAYLGCYCAGIRVTKGEARYTEEFAPPPYPFLTI